MWLTLLAFFKGNKGPYGVAMAAMFLVGYLTYIDIPDIKLGIVAAFAAAVAIAFFVARNTRPETTPQQGIDRLLVKFGDKEPIELTEDTMAIVLELTADQQVPFLGFEATDRTGGPVPVTNPVLEVVTEGAFEILEIDGVKKLRPAKQGICQFKVGADPIPGEIGEAGEIFGYFEINVTPGVAKTINPTFGEIESIPTE